MFHEFACHPCTGAMLIFSGHSNLLVCVLPKWALKPFSVSDFCYHISLYNSLPSSVRTFVFILDPLVNAWCSCHLKSLNLITSSKSLTYSQVSRIWTWISLEGGAWGAFCFPYQQIVINHSVYHNTQSNHYKNHIKKYTKNHNKQT